MLFESDNTFKINYQKVNIFKTNHIPGFQVFYQHFPAQLEDSLVWLQHQNEQGDQRSTESSFLALCLCCWNGLTN